MKKKIITTIEITPTHAKFLQARKSRLGPVLAHLDIEPIQNYSEDDIVKTLVQMTARKKLPLKGVIGIVPRRWVILRHMALPSQEGSEIRKMVNLQIIQSVPYAREDIIYDYLFLEQGQDGYSKVLTAIVHKDVVQRYLKIFQKAKIPLQKLTLSSLGLSSWYQYQQRMGGEDKTMPGGATALLNLEDAESEICFLSDHKIAFSRNIQFGMQDLDEEHIGNFLNQIELTWKSYQKENMGPSLEKFVLVGGAGQAELLKERLAQEYHLPIEVLDPLKAVHAPTSLNLLSGREHLASQAVVGIGIIFSDTERLLNLLPADIQLSKVMQVERNRWAKSAVMAAGVLVCGLLAFNVEAYHSLRRLKLIQNKAKEIKADVKRAQETIAKVNFLQGYIYERITMADILAELHRLTPEDIAFRSVTVDAGGLLTLQGLSKTGTSVNNFQNQLVNSPMFQEVNLLYTSRLRSFQEEFTEFKITCQLSTKESKE